MTDLHYHRNHVPKQHCWRKQAFTLKTQSTCDGGNIMSRDDGIIGVSDHGGWADLVTVAGDGTLLDRRRVELVDKDLPKIPHHSEGQALPHTP
jgi:hypothetical protein